MELLYQRKINTIKKLSACSKLRIEKLYKNLEQALTLYKRNNFEVYCEGLL